VEPVAESPALVSVVIPTYNRAHLVGRAIRSVLGQTFSDFELIVVDDGSTDNTVEVVRGFQDPRIRLVRLAKNCGGSRARNEGIRVARGEWVAFLDDDDEWLPRKLELQVARLSEFDDPRVTVVYCLYIIYDELTGRESPNTNPEANTIHEGEVFDHLLRGWRSCHTAGVMVKRSSLLDVGGFDKELPTSHDRDLWLRLAQAGNHFATVKEVLVVVRENTGPRLSTDLRAMMTGAKGFDRKWGLPIRDRLGGAAYRRLLVRRYRMFQYVGFMQVRQAMARGERMEAWGWCMAMCRFLPWSRKFLVRGLALVILGRRVYAALAGARDALFR
jgi:glycosyltransferase involved in cell wall biosynthesis